MKRFLAIVLLFFSIFNVFSQKSITLTDKSKYNVLVGDTINCKLYVFASSEFYHKEAYLLEKRIFLANKSLSSFLSILNSNFKDANSFEYIPEYSEKLKNDSRDQVNYFYDKFKIRCKKVGQVRLNYYYKLEVEGAEVEPYNTMGSSVINIRSKVKLAEPIMQFSPKGVSLELKTTKEGKGSGNLIMGETKIGTFQNNKIEGLHKGRYLFFAYDKALGEMDSMYFDVPDIIHIVNPKIVYGNCETDLIVKLNRHGSDSTNLRYRLNDSLWHKSNKFTDVHYGEYTIKVKDTVTNYCASKKVNVLPHYHTLFVSSKVTSSSCIQENGSIVARLKDEKGLVNNRSENERISYSWKNSQGLEISVDSVVNNLEIGKYTLDIVYDNGKCNIPLKESYEIKKISDLVAKIDPINKKRRRKGQEIKLFSKAKGGTKSYEYQWQIKDKNIWKDINKSNSSIFLSTLKEGKNAYRVWVKSGYCTTVTEEYIVKAKK